MSVYYVSNENGDWWTIDTESKGGSTLYCITEEELKKATGEEDIDGLDKLEDEIKEHGKFYYIKIN
jgi:hypothetical protein